MPIVNGRVAFIGCPKTGTGFVQRAFESIGDPLHGVGDGKHGIETLKNHRNNRTVLTNVRHPLGWFASAYCYMQHAGGMPGPACVLNAYSLKPFPDFIRLSCDKGDITAIIFEPYLCQADHVLRTEDIASDLAALLPKLKYSAEQANQVRRRGPENVANPERYPEYTDDLVQIVLQSQTSLIDDYYAGRDPNGIVAGCLVH